jgi:uncharacterized RDD family membrane protein YckC
MSANASLWRRLAAMFYDLLLLFAWVFLPWLVIFMIMGRAYEGIVFQAIVYLQVGVFFTYFWRLRGQTLGMQVWKIRTVNDSGQILTLGECAVRYFFATFSLMFMGLGFLWILFDPERLAWHDRASGTRVVFLGSDAYKSDVNATQEDHPGSSESDQADSRSAE